MRTVSKAKLAQIEKFNERCPVGSDVTVRRDDGSETPDKVRYPASIMGGHTPVAWLEKLGSYELSRVKPAKVQP